MKWIDLHCDTLSILTEKGRPEKKGRKGGLWENDLCVDIRRLHESGAAAQFFACYVNAADFRGDFKMTAATRKMTAAMQKMTAAAPETMQERAWRRAGGRDLYGTGRTERR